MFDQLQVIERMVIRRRRRRDRARADHILRPPGVAADICRISRFDDEAVREVELLDQLAIGVDAAELTGKNGAAAQRDRKSTRLNSSHYCASRMPSTA